MKHACRLLAFASLALLALDVAAFAMLSSRAKALDAVEAAQVAAVDDDVPLGGWQTTPPPVGVDIVAYFEDDFDDGIADRETPIGKWTSRGTFEHTYVDNGKRITYVVKTRCPDAWTLAPSRMLP